MSKNIIDSLFLELGIDTTKFSADQQKALAKISQFESQAKRSAKGARDAVQTVGAAFRDLANDSRIGASAKNLDSFAGKLKSLGTAAAASGGIGGMFGEMAVGLGAILSPATIAVATIGLLTKGAFDLNAIMTASNATLARQAQLTGMNADNLWAWGEAARAVGANPQDVTGGIAGLQTAIQGMGIGAANASPQINALARLGVGFDFNNGANIDQLFAKVHAMAASRGYKNLGALRALTSSVMNDAMFNIATDREFNPNDLHKQISAMEPQNLSKILQESLKSQEVLGKLGIQKDILAETTYGGEQGLMQAMVELLTGILSGVTRIADFITNLNPMEHIRGWLQSGDEKLAMKALSGLGEANAAAIVGNLRQESGMNPFARNGGHVGIAQWDTARQAAFAKQFGYQMGSSGVAADRQLTDQLSFLMQELQGKYRKSLLEMNKTQDLMGKTSSFMRLYEIVDDNLAKRVQYAQQLYGKGSVSNTSHETHIGDIHVHTPSTDPQDHAEAVKKGISTHPLIGLNAQGTTALATRGMVV